MKIYNKKYVYIFLLFLSSLSFSNETQLDITGLEKKIIYSDLDVIFETEPKEEYLLEEKTLNLINTLNTKPIKYLAAFDTLNKYFEVTYEMYVKTIQAFVMNTDVYCGTNIRFSEAIKTTQDVLEQFLAVLLTSMIETTEQRIKLQELSCIFDSNVAFDIYNFYKKYQNQSSLILTQDYKNNKKNRLESKRKDLLY